VASRARASRQRFAGRRRADYWRNLGFPDLTRARTERAIIHELSRNKYGDEMLPKCVIDLAEEPPRRCDS